MAKLLVSARIIEQSPEQFLVIVSTSPAEPSDASLTTDLETVEAATREQAEGERRRLISVVIDRLERRGHSVFRVMRTEATAG